MSEKDKRPIPFYKDRADTLEEVGITQKQLRTWREAGLFTAELGPNTRKFTAGDIATLKLLKRMIVGLGFSIQVVQELVDGLPTPYTVPLAFTYLNLKTGKLERPRTALQQLANVYASTGTLEPLEEWLLTLALRYFEQMLRIHRSAKVYEAKRDELFERIRHMDLVARAEHPEDAYDIGDDGEPEGRAPQFILRLNGDPEPEHDLMDRLSAERYRRLKGIVQAGARALSEDETEPL